LEIHSMHRRIHNMDILAFLVILMIIISFITDMKR